jgi:hypothetical protein
MRSFLVLVLSLVPSLAAAQDDPVEDVAGAWEDYPRHVAFEVNVLWPFFPGGIVDLKAIVPLLLPDRGDWRGELVAGLHSDFGWRSVRDDDAGNVAFLGLKIGWRQFLVYGLHLDVTANLGWRHQEHNPWDNETIHAFQGRFWGFAGYQHELTRQVYVNVRGGIGIHLFRTDRFADREKIFVPAGDLNLGFRFD